ncbi:MAG: hypothetical protein IKA79_07070, partial [Lentisphaeria bacterium]|nr:hypothetical protein [Lentisphaeria bacterium]
MFIAVFFILCSTITVLPQKMYGQVTLSGSGITGNPRLFYRGLTGAPPELNTKIRNTLWASGWFDLIGS